MKFKKTRIAFSAFWGILSILLIGLWVRSQSSVDTCQFRMNSNWGVQIGGLPGSVVVDTSDMILGWKVSSFPTSHLRGPANYSKLWGRFIWRPRSIMVPFWFLVLLTGIVAAVLFPYRQLQWRFSLRTLLIATTAVAVALWFIVWMARS